MTRFADILTVRSGDDPVEAQRQARQRFPAQVGQSRLSLRSPTVPVPSAGVHLILGVASYSPRELGLLDEVDATLGGDNGRAADVAVFDVLDCQQASDFQKFIPGLPPVYETPVVGVIAGGKLVESAAGLDEVEGVLRRHNVLAPHPVSP
ncbi:MAG TPA: hypothetical protein VMF30_17435 [Pirellulales bacterium]|nr:hypothetical protein [Pirellulales bacterium]